MDRTLTQPVKPMRRTLSHMGLRFHEDAAGPGSAEGYGSTFDTVNSYGDCIRPGAFTETIPEFLANGFIAQGHKWSALPVGMPTAASEDAVGLFLRWDWHSTQDAQECRLMCQERQKAGLSIGLSIGFEIIGYELVDPNDRWGAWAITKCKLYECSVVTAPADPKAHVTRVHSALPDGATLADLSETLQDDVDELLGRYEAIRQMRQADGRHWSAENRRRLADWRERARRWDALLCDMLAEPTNERDRLALAIELERLRGEDYAPLGA